MIAIKGMDMPANCGECPLTYPVGFYRNLPYDSLEKYEAQLLIFAAQCCFIWYQIEIFESAMRKK